VRAAAVQVSASRKITSHYGEQEEGDFSNIYLCWRLQGMIDQDIGTQVIARKITVSFLRIKTTDIQKTVKTSSARWLFMDFDD
jgi:hypothetical protein